MTWAALGLLRSANIWEFPKIRYLGLLYEGPLFSETPISIIPKGPCTQIVYLYFGLKRSPYSVHWARSMCYLGGCQNYGPFLGTLNNRCRTIIGTQKGTIILTTAHLGTWALREGM